MTAGRGDGAGPGADERGSVASAVRRWLALDRDVVVRGDDGSGRSRVLRLVLADASRRGLACVLVAAAADDAPLSALRGHPSVVGERIPAAPGALTDWLAGELRARRSLLLVDDLDLLDTASAEVVLQALRRSPARLVATAGADLTTHPDAVVSSLVAERAPAEVRLHPLGLTGVSRLLAEVLRAPADVALTSTVTAGSGGNPRVALALLDAARYTGAAEQVGARWRQVGSLDDAPLDAVAHALLTRLPPAQVEALELLAWAGTVPVAAAEQALGADTVRSLVVRGRLRRFPSAGGEALAVSPPALAAALRSRLTADRRADLDRRVVDELGAEAPFASRPTVLLAEDDEHDEHGERAADLTGLVHERAAAQEVRLRTAWQADPTVERADAYLAALLLRRAPAQVEAVLAETEVTGHEPVEALASFRLHELRWASWRGESAAALEARLRDLPEELAAVRDLAGLRRAALADPEHAPPTDADQGDGAAHRAGRLDGGVLPRWSAVARAAGLLDAGRPDLALTACDAVEPGPVPGDADHHLDGLHAESLLQLGRLHEAQSESRRRLERACADLDLLGIRVHAPVLAEALLLQGEPSAAWRVLGTSLRLGPGGALDTTFYRRSLSLGAVVLARLGAADVAELLLDELDETPATSRPALRALGAVARAALAHAQGTADGDLDGDAGGGPGGDPLWVAGERYAAEGLRLAALTCWLARPRPYDAGRLTVVRAMAERCRLPLLDRSLRLHEALAAHDQDAVVAALASSPVDVTGLVAYAVGTLDEEHAAHEAVRGLRLAAATDVPVRDALSAREREVAALASAGLTNRQIADRLTLSVRTVENHVSNALRKLGVSGRTDLARWFAEADHGSDDPQGGTTPS